MSLPNDRGPTDPAGEELSGLHILLVEDSWHVGKALKNLLRALGASVAGPAATSADAERLIAEQMPDVGIVDFSLRHGEQAQGLIGKLNALGVRVIVVSGYEEVPLAPGTTALVLQKPVREAELLAALRPVAAQKAAR
jgi:DNA-binding NtrC family response regulator